MGIPAYNPGTTRRPITVKPVNVKPYVTQGGSIVTAHQQRHRIAEPIVKNSEIEGYTERTPIQPKQINTSDVPVIHLKSEPSLISSAVDSHTSTVYCMPDDKGRTGYFKPESGAVWQIKNAMDEVVPIRKQIQDDRQVDREVLASDIGNLLGMRDTIPQTKRVRAKYEQNDYGEGSLQMDAKDVLKNQGYTHNISPFTEWRTKTKNEFYDKMFAGSVDTSMESQEYLNGKKREVFENGGMDLAFFDFIVGNCDRTRHNFFVGTHPETSKQKIVGIDHGLTFPNEKLFNSRDIHNTSFCFWSDAQEFGSNVSVRDSFKKALSDEHTWENFRDTVSSSNLNDSEKLGTLERFKMVASHLSTHGELTGRSLKKLEEMNTRKDAY